MIIDQVSTDPVGQAVEVWPLRCIGANSKSSQTFTAWLVRPWWT